MTLELESDSKDMELRSADLIETGRNLLDECFAWTPIACDSCMEKSAFEAQVHAATCLQIISGCCEHEAKQAISIVQEQNNRLVEEGKEDD